MESPGFWFLLIIPATAAILAYQHLEHATSRHPGALASQTSVNRFDVLPAASPPDPGNPQPVRQSSARGDGGEHAGMLHSHTGLTINANDHAPLSSGGQEPADAVQRAKARQTTVQGASIGTAVDVNPGIRNPENGTYREIPSTSASEPPLNAELVAILDENPYLPVADDEYAEAGIADNPVSPRCPETLFRGGNDYAILRLTLMGCDIPGI